MLRVLGSAVLLALSACGSTAPEPIVDRDLRVLFIGNSLTYTNDVPGRVAEVAALLGGPRIEVAQVAFGSFSLEDHWVQGDALEEIGKGGWDYVLLQQGPSTLPASRLHLIEWSTRFAERIRAAGARPAIFMIWPSDGNYDGVSRSYRDAAAAVDGTLAPAGEAFRAVARDHPGIAIHQGDGFHPSAAGAYLAALVICGRLLRREVEGVGTGRSLGGLSRLEFAELERAADRANRDFGRD
jgi:hypothetical protein